MTIKTTRFHRSATLSVLFFISHHNGVLTGGGSFFSMLVSFVRWKTPSDGSAWICGAHSSQEEEEESCAVKAVFLCYETRPDLPIFSTKRRIYMLP